MTHLVRVGSRSAAALLCAALCAQSAYASGEIAFLAHDGLYWQVWRMNPDGSEQSQVTRSEYDKARVSWFPDGTRLLVSTIDGRLVSVDTRTGEEAQLSIALTTIHDAAVSPNGLWLALSANTGGARDTNDIWLAKSDGTSQRRLVAMPWLQHEPRWDANGEWIYFLSGDGQQDHDIWRMRVADGSREQLTVGARYHFEIDVAPEGAIAFSSNRTGDYEIYTRSPSGALTRWTDSPGLDGHPAWSPTGDRLIFHSTRSGTLNLFAKEGPSSKAAQLTDLPGGARAPAWHRPAQ